MLHLLQLAERKGGKGLGDAVCYHAHAWQVGPLSTVNAKKNILLLFVMMVFQFEPHKKIFDSKS